MAITNTGAHAFYMSSRKQLEKSDKTQRCSTWPRTRDDTTSFLESGDLSRKR